MVHSLRHGLMDVEDWWVHGRWHVPNSMLMSTVLPGSVATSVAGQSFGSIAQPM